MSQEISRILKMVEEGKINSEKAAELIEALKEPKGELINLSKEEPKSTGKMLKIRVNSNDGDNVNINFPLSFVSGMIKTFGKIPNMNISGMENVNKDEMNDTILHAIDGNFTGKILEVKSGDGDIVEIIIE